MANLPINLLPAVSTINPDSLFVLEQNGNASKVTADTFRRQWIGEQGQFKPKGKYSTLTELRNAVPNPELGDYYYVGTTAPFTVYAALNIGQSDPWVSVGALGTSVQSTADQLQFPSGVNTGSGDISSFLVGNTARPIKDTDALDLTTPGTSIPSAADLNNYSIPGVYRTTGGAITASLANCPVKSGIFKLLVMVAAPTATHTQLLISSLGPVYLRNVGATSTAWTRIDNSDVSNPNLLDNWYLANPINQRGQNSYTNLGYGFDRWSTNFSSDTTSLSTDGIKVLTTSTIGGWHFHQIFLDAEQLIGKSVTLSVDVSAMNGTNMRWRCSFRDSKSSSTSGNNELAGSFSLAADLGITSGSATVPTGTKAIWIGLYASSGVTSGDYVTTRRVKLEIGTTQTLENDAPDLSAELLKCQRYFVRYSGEISLYGYASSNGSAAYAQMLYPVTPMGAMSCSLDTITVISDTGRTTGNSFTMGTSVRANRQPMTINGLSITGYRPILAKFDSDVEFSCEP